jgi:hypothetical protein
MEKPKVIPKQYSTPDMIQRIDNTIIRYGTIDRFIGSTILELELPEQPPIVPTLPQLVR